MAEDVEKTLATELRDSKLSLQLDESTFGSSTLLMACLRSLFNERQKCWRSKDVTIIQDRTVLLEFLGKLSLFRVSLSCRELQYFSTYNKYKVKAILMGDLEMHMNHLENLIEDFNVHFENLEWMKVPDWILTPFDVEIRNADIASHLEEEFTEMTVDLEASALFRRKGLSELWINENNVAKYPRLCEVVEPFLLAFPSSYIAEAGFSHAYAVLTKQMSRLSLRERSGLRLKLTNLQTNTSILVESHQAHPSH
ncbi:SCAN domain-containing protein 3-like [Macrobrachium nipponense]|uniref:SCAN domain-containing protein 3-like n=1 Tax=Macrobrachium nipponense TaxID=159736 RepID=UPI0030C88310